MARPSQDPQIRINEILDTAEPLFYAYGYRETAISDIAQKMGVAQGTLYYYFKSKEEILEALINRQISAFISEIKVMASSGNFTPPRKLELMISTLFASIRHEKGLMFEFLYTDQTIHLVDKLSRRGKYLLAPWLLTIIEEGKRQNYFHVSHPKSAVNFILAIIQCLIDAIYEKLPAELLTSQCKMGEGLIEKTLGLPEKTIHIAINVK
jgi:AcrR family transcriptional regulator